MTVADLDIVNPWITQLHIRSTMLSMTDNRSRSVIVNLGGDDSVGARAFQPQMKEKRF